MGKSASGLALIKQKNPLGKFNTNGEILDQQIRKIEAEIANGENEGTEPQIREVKFSPYKGSEYILTCDGIIKSVTWEAMKYIFYENKLGPRVRIKRLRKKFWEKTIRSEYYEVNVLTLMKQYFPSYIEWYSKAKDNLDDYILLPKDGNRENLSTTNLYFCSKKDYHNQGSKREIVKTLLTLNPKMTDAELEKAWISRPHISRVRSELGKQGKLPIHQKLLKLREKTGIQIEFESLPIYEALLQSQGKLSNTDIVKLLRPHERNQAKTNEEKRKLTDKIVRVRKKLTDRELIPRFNANFEEKRERAVEMINERQVTGKTNKEIAEALGLNKAQIDNLAKWVKKG